MSAQTLNIEFTADTSDETFLACLEVRNSNNFYAPLSLEEFRSFHELTPAGKVSEPFVARLDGTPVGYGWVNQNFWSTDNEGKFEATANVRLDHPHRAEIFRQVLAEAVRRARAHGATTLDTDTRHDFTEAPGIIASMGFEERMRFPYSVLTLAEFDEAPFLPKVEAAKAQGLEIVNGLQVLERWPDWKTRFWEMNQEIVKDIPYVDEFREEPFEEWVRWIDSPVLFQPETWWICVEGDRWLGTTSFKRNRIDPSSMNTGLTGVRREGRRRGIATALKVQAILEARALGGRWVTTDNEENNPMYQLNVDLGFKAAWYWVLFRQAND